MTISAFIQTYNLHDSLLESITVDKDEKTVRLGIDFCYWQQGDYDDRLPETGLAHVHFFDVERVDYEPWEINSDDILQCAYDNETNTFRMDVLDASYDLHSIRIKATHVSFLRKG